MQTTTARKVHLVRWQGREEQKPTTCNTSCSSDRRCDSMLENKVEPYASRPEAQLAQATCTGRWNTFERMIGRAMIQCDGMDPYGKGQECQSHFRSTRGILGSSQNVVEDIDQPEGASYRRSKSIEIKPQDMRLHYSARQRRLQVGGRSRYKLVDWKSTNIQNSIQHGPVHV